MKWIITDYLGEYECDWSSRELTEVKALAEAIEQYLRGPAFFIKRDRTNPKYGWLCYRGEDGLICAVDYYPIQYLTRQGYEEWLDYHEST